MHTKANKYWLVLAGVACLGTYLNASATSCVQGKNQVQDYVTYFKQHLHANSPAQADQQVVLVQEVLNGQTADLREALDEKTVDPNTIFHLGPVTQMPLLGIAVVGCQNDIAQALVKAGADVNGTPGSRPLSIAAANGDASMAAFLLQNGAPIDTVDGLGQTPLEVAVRQRQISTFQLFLARDPHPDRKLAGGHTLLDLVTPSEDPTDLAIANQLRSHGVKNGTESNTN